MPERWVSLAAAHTAGEAGHSLAPLPFIPWEGSPASSFSKLCCLEERDEAGKFLLQICPKFICFVLEQGSTGISPLETQALQRLSHQSVSAQLSVFQVFLDCSQEVLESFHRFLSDHMGICLLIT